MPFEYVGLDEAIGRAGLRMVVVGDVPSPWGEAAKGFLHLKKLDWAAVRLAYGDARLGRWAGEVSGPVLIHESEAPCSGWREILLRIERLAPAPALLPSDPAPRAQALELAGDFCDANVGLGWNRRLQLVHAGLEKTGGFSERVAGYLGGKYGYVAADADEYGRRVRASLARFAALLHDRGGREGGYYLGTLSAVDVFSATFMALFAPLPVSQCRMAPAMRTALETLDAETRGALDPVLLQHRDMMYARHLELPLSL